MGWNLGTYLCFNDFDATNLYRFHLTHYLNIALLLLQALGAFGFVYLTRNPFRRNALIATAVSFVWVGLLDLRLIRDPQNLVPPPVHKSSDSKHESVADWNFPNRSTCAGIQFETNLVPDEISIFDGKKELDFGRDVTLFSEGAQSFVYFRTNLDCGQRALRIKSSKPSLQFTKIQLVRLEWIVDGFISRSLRRFFRSQPSAR